MLKLLIHMYFYPLPNDSSYRVGYFRLPFPFQVAQRERERQTERERERYRQTERDREKNRQTNRQKDRQKKRYEKER